MTEPAADLSAPGFADVSINLAAIDRSYHYSIPADLQGSLIPGSLVAVPFNKRTVQGVVLSLLSEAEVAKPLPVEALLSEETVLSSQQIQLAQWLAEATFAPLGACISLMIPTGLSQRAEILLTLNTEPSETPEDVPPLQKRILSLLRKRGPLRGSQIERALPKLNWHKSVEALRQADRVRTNSYLPPPRVSPKTIRMAQLSVPPESVTSLQADDLSTRADVGERRLRVLQLLVQEAFPIDFSWIYAQTGSNFSDLKLLAENGYLHFVETEVWRDPLETVQVNQSLPPTLTSDQEAVWAKLQHAMTLAEKRPSLLYGVTGSGKTEIYMRVVAEKLALGQQALILVPEIAMTPQTVRRYMARFPNRVGLYHSKLSEGERYDTWRRAQAGDLDIIIGARSALFVPLHRLGLIVMDECDQESYDQTDRLPFYHAAETAEAYAQICGADLILGSATPRVSQYYRAEKGELRLLELPKRVYAHRDSIQEQAARLHISFPVLAGEKELLSLELPSVEVVDMRAELKAGNTNVLSRSLAASLQKTLDAQEQAILFLNRKGSATFVFCRECGEAIRCPRDESSLVYHSSRQALLCHVCSYQRKMPKKCPHCGSPQIRQLGLGTEKLEILVKEAFPGARILRWDAETSTGKNAHELILSHFSAHRADILIGTQMLAKGLDLPLVTLVGIILAEVGLNLPDYRAAERSFQVLTQVAGRAGRSPLGGKVVLQTYQPQNYVIQAAANHDFAAFYQQELNLRRLLAYPPYTRLVRLEYRHSSEETCEQAAVEMAQILRAEITGLNMPDTSFIGPVPAYVRKLYGQYRWQIILRGPEPTALLPGLPLRNWTVEVDPPNLL